MQPKYQIFANGSDISQKINGRLISLEISDEIGMVSDSLTIELDNRDFALGKLLRNYNRHYGIRTINSIITRFAPSTENQTDAYIKSVAHSTGYDPYTQLNLEDTKVLVNLCQAIIKHENGKQPYSLEEIEAAIQC